MKTSDDWYAHNFLLFYAKWNKYLECFNDLSCDIRQNEYKTMKQPAMKVCETIQKLYSNIGKFG